MAPVPNKKKQALDEDKMKKKISAMKAKKGITKESLAASVDALNNAIHFARRSPGFLRQMRQCLVYLRMFLDDIEEGLADRELKKGRSYMKMGK